jgi:hypothetical protein
MKAAIKMGTTDQERFLAKGSTQKGNEEEVEFWKDRNRWRGLVAG